MSDASAFELPAEYCDWVEATNDQIRMRTEYIKVEVTHYPNGPLKMGTQVLLKDYVRPKPKPTLPEVSMGGAVHFLRKSNGKPYRAVRCANSTWIVFGEDRDLGHFTDEQLLRFADDDPGFLVELKGV